MNLNPRSWKWVMMIKNKTSDQYLTTGKVSTRSIMKLRRYRLLKTLTWKPGWHGRGHGRGRWHRRRRRRRGDCNSSSVFRTGELKRQKVNEKRKRCVANKSKTSPNDLSTKWRDQGRHAMFAFLSSLPIPVWRILDIEANMFYDRNHQMCDAVLLSRFYTQYALRPFIDSEINHQRHCIKIPFINTAAKEWVYMRTEQSTKCVYHVSNWGWGWRP